MSSKDTEAAAYAFWTSPDDFFTVTYSLDLFHEIDFQVSEAYRRIPHGGIEVGGILFGTIEPAGVRLQAFRAITCEHATGPSFFLSDRDLEDLQEQLGDSATDPELAGLEAVGWFISHSRSVLRATDREMELFDRLFPGPGRVIVLAKPERFQPTRFAFLVREKGGGLERDGTAHAVILPLPGRGGRPGEGPVPSISAPTEKDAGLSAPSHKPVVEPEIERPLRLAAKGQEPESRPVVAALQREIAKSEPVEAVLPIESPELPEPLPRSVPERRPSRPRRGRESEITTVLTAIPKEDDLAASEVSRRQREVQRRSSISQPTNAYALRLILILLFAAALGCFAGYWAYLQLPPPVVSLTAHMDGSRLTVSWPAAQTHEAVYAAIRVNDGSQQPLSPEERSAGSVRITPPVGAANVKVELIVQHWMRDSRGIVRYVSPPSLPNPATAPNQ